MGLFTRLLFWRAGDNSGTERHKEDETRTLTKYYTLYVATVTYPDGDTEHIKYTKCNYGSDIIKIFNHESDDYYAYRKTPFAYGGSPNLRLRIDHGKARRFSVSNIRDIDIKREEKMVAVAEVEATVTYKGDEQVDIRLKSGEDTPDVEIWHKSEWEAQV